MSKKPAPKAAPPEALSTIIASAELLARRREQLGTLVASLNRGIEALKADALPEIRVAIDEAAEAWKRLEGDLKAHPELFERPKSLEAHGIKFGYRKGAGGLVIDDADRTVELIEKHFPEQTHLLISLTKRPVKDALNQLSASDLKRVGVQVEGSGDVVFIKPAEGGLDKVVKALVAAAVDGGE